MSRITNASRNIIWGTIGRGIGLILPFVCRTVMIKTIGIEYVGLSGLFSSLLVVLSFAELGIGNALVFSMYKPVAEGNDDKVCALLAFYRKCYFIIGCFILVCGIIMLPFVPNLIKGDIPSDINVYWLFAIYLTNNLLGYFLFAYKNSIFIACQQNHIASKVTLVTNIVLNLSRIILLLLYKNFYCFAVVLPVITLVNNIIVSYMAGKYYPKYICRGNLEKSEIKEIALKVGGMVFQKVGGIAMSSVDTLIISSFLGLVTLGMYNNYYIITTSLTSFLAILTSSIVSVIGNSIVTESKAKNKDDFIKFNFIYVWLVAWMTVTMLVLYQPFMQIWVGQKLMFSNAISFLFTFCFFVHHWCDTLYIYQEATGAWWETKFVPLLVAICNLVTSIVLLEYIGFAGILVATILSCFIYIIGYAKVIVKGYFGDILSLKSYLSKQIFYMISTLFVSTITYYCCSYIEVGNIYSNMGISIIVCLLLPNLLLWLMWRNLNEYKLAYAFVARNFLKSKEKRNSGIN